MTAAIALNYIWSASILFIIRVVFGEASVREKKIMFLTTAPLLDFSPEPHLDRSTKHFILHNVKRINIARASFRLISQNLYIVKYQQWDTKKIMKRYVTRVINGGRYFKVIIYIYIYASEGRELSRSFFFMKQHSRTLLIFPGRPKCESKKKFMPLKISYFLRWYQRIWRFSTKLTERPRNGPPKTFNLTST